MNNTSNDAKPPRPRRMADLLIRLSGEERETIATAAEIAKLPLATWSRSVLLRAAAKAGGKRDAAGG
jgi:hypothetical protein